MQVKENKIKPLFENLLTLDELRECLGNRYVKGTLYQWVNQGMPKKKIGGKLWFEREKVAKWIQAHKME